VRTTLIYTTDPVLRPLLFVSDPSDVPGVIERMLEGAQARRRLAEERIAKVGGAVASDKAIRTWKNARWVEINI
jgi:hypothetical protein